LNQAFVENNEMHSNASVSLASFAALASTLCNPLPQGQSIGNTANVTLESGGIYRSYLISIPPAYNCSAPTPLILSFHGGDRNASQQQELSQMSNPEFNNFAIAVYPLGMDVRSLSNVIEIELKAAQETWQGVPGDSANDLQFVTDIINQLEQEYNIDPARIWATGMSDGGGFCNTIACDPILSGRIAAFASVSGAFYINESNSCSPDPITIPCNPGRPKIPIIEFHGYLDTTIPYEGGARNGACLPSIPYWAQEWALRDGLAATNVATNLTSDTLVYTFGEGSENGLVIQVTDFNLGHDWPSNVQVGNSELASFNATPIIIDFFMRNPLAAQTTTSATGSLTGTSASSKPTGNAASGLVLTWGIASAALATTLGILYF
jgi:poly(3-hydroxybutyrate) depolymerase